MMLDTSIVDLLADGDLVGAIEYVYGGAMPLLLFSGIVGGLVILTVYINSRSIALTGVVMMLSGAVVVQYLPPEAQMAGYAFIALAAAAVLYSIYTGRNRPVR
jgi:hypothetical protein